MSSSTRFVTLVPAAGRSRRMGCDKLLLDWGETVVLGSVVDALAAGSGGGVTVVVERDQGPLWEWLRARDQAAAVSGPTPGMLETLLAGLESLGGANRLAESGADLLVCPGDHAGLSASSVRRVCDALRAGAPIAVATFGGHRGHPLGVSSRRVGEIADLDPDVGLRQLLDRHRDELVEVPVDDPAVVRDLDTPEAYERARAEDGTRRP